MSLFDDITNAVNGIKTSMPELTGTVTPKNGTAITCIFTTLGESSGDSEIGKLFQVQSYFNILKEERPASGMDAGDVVTLVNYHGVSREVRITTINATMNFLEIYFESVNA